MNKFKLNILALGLLCGWGLSSCSESFLDVESKTESTTGTFYKTESDAWRALIGCYDGWKLTGYDSNGGFSFYVASEVMADECFGGTGNTDGRNHQLVDRFDITQSPSDLNVFESTWKSYYAAVYRCNELIAHEEQIQWKDENKRKLYMGECHALRAILYFDMVRLWGNIPLFTEPVNENREQADPSEVFEVIFSDLKYAVENIPADAYPKSQSESNDGHVTKYAAAAMMARAYLFYTGYYGATPESVTKDEVLAGLEDIISSDEFDLIPEYKNLWPAASTKFAADSYNVAECTYAGDGNKETVLAQKFTNTATYDNGNVDGNKWLVMVGIRGVNSSPYGKGWGACTVNPEFVKNYGSGDTRRSASIIDLEGEAITAITDFEKNNKKDQREYTGYTIKKYTPLSFFDGKPAPKPDGSGDMQISQNQDYVIMRYADVLLMAAELGSPSAQDYFNKVRERAYTTADGLSSSYTEVAVSAENIKKERMLEFAFEGIRYWDLLRQGIDNAANAIAVSNYSVLSGGNPDAVTIAASKIKETKGLCQIPYNQINLSNNVLVQNAGW